MSQLGRDSNGRSAQFGNPSLTQPIITTSEVSAQSAACVANIIEIWSSADGFYATGADPTATSTPGANGIRIRAGEARTINIEPGHKVAFILAAGMTGTAEVTEMS